MMRNKIFTGLAAVAILSLFFSCASTDDGVKEVVFNAEDTAVEQTADSGEQEINESDAMVVTTQEETDQKIISDVPLSAKETKKNYTGWVSTSIRPITNTVGNISLNVRPKKGTFSIAVLNENDKSIPVLSTANEYTTTSLYLKAGKKILKLCDDANVVSAAKKTANGISILYTIEKVAVVQLDFECIASVEGENEDTVKITATVQSLAKKKQEYALKFLFDTVLGETDRHHFYTSDDSPVKGEVLYHTMADEKWIASKNAKANMQFIFYGADITPVESVALANFTTLDTRKWEADMTTFRSFDTVLSYNNSAVAVYWPKTMLEPEAEYSEVFYVSLATGENIPGGAAYIEALTAPAAEEEVPEETVEPAAKAQDTGVQNIQAVKEEPAKTETKKNDPMVLEPQRTSPKSEVQEKPQEPAPEVKPQSVPAVEEKVPEKAPVKDRRFSPDYIQELLDRIEALEEGDPTVNKAEINALNDELDYIISVLNAQ